MKRALVGAVAIGLLLAACGDSRNEQAANPVQVAFLRAVPGVPSTEPSFKAELRSLGFVEGRNLTLIDSDASIAYPDEGDATKAVNRWERQGVDLILALSTTGARVVSKEAPRVPVVFISNDPTATGLVRSEQRPEGNLTGVTFRVPADRTLSMLKRALPGLARVGLAYPAGDPAAIANRDALTVAAEEAGVALVTAEFDAAETAGAAIDTLASENVDALVLSTSPLAVRALEQTAKAAERHGLPVISNTTLAEFAVVSLAPDVEEMGRQMARQAARLLSGTRVALVPVEDPRRFVLTVNAAAAAAMGLSLPESLLREANKVVQ